MLGSKCIPCHYLSETTADQIGVLGNITMPINLITSISKFNKMFPPKKKVCVLTSQFNSHFNFFCFSHNLIAPDLNTNPLLHYLNLGSSINSWSELHFFSLTPIGNNRRHNFSSFKHQLVPNHLLFFDKVRKYY
jgi:hypothetical protein